MTETPPTGEKLQKILASRGMGSRREIERWIEDGRVVVNGKTANLGDRAQPDDRIEVDKKNVDLKAQTHRVLIYNKPELRPLILPGPVNICS